MTNRAEPRACGQSRGSRRLDTEPETKGTVGPASNEVGNGFGRTQGDEPGLQLYWNPPPYGMNRGGGETGGAI
jgi:hypothetical protein